MKNILGFMLALLGFGIICDTDGFLPVLIGVLVTVSGIAIVHFKNVMLWLR